MEPKELDRLFHAYLEGTLDEAGAAALRKALKDPALRRRWRDLTDLEGSLADRYARPSTRLLKPVSFFRTHRQRLFAVAAMLLLGVIAGWIYSLIHPSEEKGNVLAHVLYVVWDDTAETAGVSVARGLDVSPLAAGQPVCDGDELRAPVGYFLALQFDGEETVVEVSAGGAARVYMRDGGKRIELTRGRLAARVAKQPPGCPMIVVTPHARATVLGTQLELAVEPARSQVTVTEGSVQVLDLKTQATATVSAGEQVGVDNVSAPEVAKVAPVELDAHGRIVYDEGFDAGLPSNWNMGQWVGQGLPEGDTGAVRSMPRNDNHPHRYAVSTHAAPHSSPFFLLTPSTMLHLTFNMERPGRIIFFLTILENGRFRDNLAFTKLISDPGWQTVDIPIWDFRPTKLTAIDELLGSACTRYWVQTMSREDLGFTLSRIWATSAE